MYPGRANQRILCFASYFIPGYRAGGPIRSLQRIIGGLCDDFDFRVVSRDRDLAASEPYPDVASDRWSEAAGIKIWYLRPPHWAPGTIRRVIADFEPDLLYFQSFLDPSLVAMPLILRRLGMLSRHIPALVAPRGEFAPSALALKKRQKSAWLTAVKGLGLYRDVTWQASNEMEATHIHAHWGRDARVLIAPNLPPLFDVTMPPVRRRKVPGALRAVFLSRISPMKNLDGALRMLAMTRMPMSLDIYGNQESAEYWRECERLMQDLPSHVTVNYHGNVPPEEVIDVMAAYDLFFLPTLGENFGHVILEALLAGCPVLISDRTPWRQLQEKRAGYELRLDQPDAFVEALEKFSAMDDMHFQEWSDGAARLGREYCRNGSLRQEVRAVLHGAMRGPG
jgi:glycosyltransferase involved in cell wall biosynthesis